MGESIDDKMMRNFDKIEVCIASIENEAHYEAIYNMIDMFKLRFADQSKMSGMTAVLNHKFKDKQDGIERR